MRKNSTRNVEVRMLLYLPQETDLIEVVYVFRIFSSHEMFVSWIRFVQCFFPTSEVHIATVIVLFDGSEIKRTEFSCSHST